MIASASGSIVQSNLKAIKFGKGIYKLIPKKISLGKQGKYILGHNNYIKGRSILKLNPQKLLDKIHAKDIKSISKAGDNKVRVDFGEVIGNVLTRQQVRLCQPLKRLYIWEKMVHILFPQNLRYYGKKRHTIISAKSYAWRSNDQYASYYNWL